MYKSSQLKLPPSLEAIYLLLQIIQKSLIVGTRMLQESTIEGDKVEKPCTIVQRPPHQSWLCH